MCLADKGQVIANIIVKTMRLKQKDKDNEEYRKTKKEQSHSCRK